MSTWLFYSFRQTNSTTYSIQQTHIIFNAILYLYFILCLFSFENCSEHFCRTKYFFCSVIVNLLWYKLRWYNQSWRVIPLSCISLLFLPSKLRYLFFLDTLLKYLDMRPPLIACLLEFTLAFFFTGVLITRYSYPQILKIYDLLCNYRPLYTVDPPFMCGLHFMNMPRNWKLNKLRLYTFIHYWTSSLIINWK